MKCWPCAVCGVLLLLFFFSQNQQLSTDIKSRQCNQCTANTGAAVGVALFPTTESVIIEKALILKDPRESKLGQEQKIFLLGIYLEILKAVSNTEPIIKERLFTGQTRKNILTSVWLIGIQLYKCYWKPDIESLGSSHTDGCVHGWEACWGSCSKNGVNCKCVFGIPFIWSSMLSGEGAFGDSICLWGDTRWSAALPGPKVAIPSYEESENEQ